MAFQDAFEEIAKDPEMTLEPKNVLLYLFSKLNFENFIQQSQKEVAESLGIHREQVSRSIKLLIRKRIIFEGPKQSRSKCYRLNPDYGWKGKVSHLDEYRSSERRKNLELIQGGKEE